MTLAFNRSGAEHRGEAGHDGRTTRGVWEIAASGPDLPDEPWESEMSEIVAHLASAFAAVERLRKLTSGAQLATIPCELASQCICTALVALDEYRIAVLRGTIGSGCEPVPSRRDSLLELFSELDLMT